MIVRLLCLFGYHDLADFGRGFCFRVWRCRRCGHITVTFDGSTASDR